MTNTARHTLTFAEAFPRLPACERAVLRAAMLALALNSRSTAGDGLDADEWAAALDMAEVANDPGHHEEGRTNR